MASASDHRAHAALQPADCLILLPQRLPAAVETSIGPAHYPAECTQSDAFLQPSLRARNGRANSNSFFREARLYESLSTPHKPCRKGHCWSSTTEAARVVVLRLRRSPRPAGRGRTMAEERSRLRAPCRICE